VPDIASRLHRLVAIHATLCSADVQANGCLHLLNCIKTESQKWGKSQISFYSHWQLRDWCKI